MPQRLLGLILLAYFIPPVSSAAGATQDSPAESDALKQKAPRVFIDCSSCDIDYILT